jgi:hypothetical protein
MFDLRYVVFDLRSLIASLSQIELHKSSDCIGFCGRLENPPDGRRLYIMLGIFSARFTGLSRRADRPVL